MGHSGRSAHIVPVVLDDVGGRGVVGITSTIGRIDLRDVVGAVEHGALNDARPMIRNRCVLPMLEKLDNVGAAEGV
jgi:hypothetical protein